MKNINVKCLLDYEKIAEAEKIEITSFEQDYEFKIGKKGYVYEASLERDCEGNITEMYEYGALEQAHDTETEIAKLFNKDPEEWYFLDQSLFDADNEERIHFVNSKEFIDNNQIINEEELNFIRENTDEDGYMTVYITVTNNTIIGEDE